MYLLVCLLEIGDYGTVFTSNFILRKSEEPRARSVQGFCIFVLIFSTQEKIGMKQPIAFLGFHTFKKVVEMF